MSDGPAEVPFRRRAPTASHRMAWGACVCLGAPATWFLEQTGLARKAFSALVSRRNRALAAQDVLAGYVPRREDVFVATYPKSGTNWMLQVVLQLAHGGAAEFDHVHDVVPWPDAALMPGCLLYTSPSPRDS